MRRPQKILLALGLGIALAGAGVAVAETTHSGSTPAASAAPPAAATTTAPAAPATVHAATATVAGKSEQILEDAQGLPLYTYGRDTATQSQVSGTLAQFWPPVVSSSPTLTGATGTLGVVADPNGQQVQYNGHFLYTFVNDSAGHVTGQGVQGFFIATPNVGATASPAATPTPAATSNPAPAAGYSTPTSTQSNPYGY